MERVPLPIEFAPRETAAYDERTQKDRDLLERALRGDRRAQSDFVKRYSRLIYRTLYTAGVSRNDIDDVYQSVQVHLWSSDGRRLRLWRGNGALGAYVATVTSRFARSGQRGRHSAQQPATLSSSQWEPTDPEPGPEERLLRQEQSAALHALLGGLSSRDADLLRRRYQEGQTYAEMAEALGMTVSHVGVALFRAEARLRRRAGSAA